MAPTNPYATRDLLKRSFSATYTPRTLTSMPIFDTFNSISSMVWRSPGVSSNIPQLHFSSDLLEAPNNSSPNALPIVRSSTNGKSPILLNHVSLDLISLPMSFFASSNPPSFHDCPVGFTRTCNHNCSPFPMRLNDSSKAAIGSLKYSFAFSSSNFLYVLLG